MLQITYLKTKPTKRALRLTLKDIPDSIVQIYKDSFASILAQPVDIASLAPNALSWVTFTYRPLTLAELQDALVVENDDHEDLPDEDVLVSSCENFITYDLNTNEIRFVRKHLFF